MEEGWYVVADEGINYYLLHVPYHRMSAAPRLAPAAGFAL